MTEQPKDHTEVSGDLKETKTLVDFVLNGCDLNQTPEALAKELHGKLKELAALFRKNGSAESDISISVQKAVYEALNISPEIRMIAEQDRAIDIDLQVIKAIIENANEILEKSNNALDADSIAGGLHMPETFHSDHFQEILGRYRQRTRNKLKRLGMDAFVQRRKVSPDEVSGLLEKNA